MKKVLIFSALLFGGCFLTLSNAQKKVYFTSGGEVIFSKGDLQFTNSYINSQPGAEIVSEPVRFSIFLHLGQNSHFDLTNNIGFFSGYGLRNVGMISDENLPEYGKVKIVRRVYSLGVPLAIKLGSFKDNYYVYAGGEYEWAFHYKEKYWNNYSRKRDKTKRGEWFGNQTNTFLPSAFVGIQFPKGINLKFKYYLTDFLNSNYSSSSVVSDLHRYKQSKMFYIALTYQVKNSDVRKDKKQDELAQY
jgi:hypothetical protein